MNGVLSCALPIYLMMEDPTLFDGFVTHRYSIDEYKTAFSVASKKGKHNAIKVAFDFGK